MTQLRLLTILKSKFWFRLFLMKSLPAAFFCGLNLNSLTEERSDVTVRFSWFTQNPFRSIYFACLAMAAEMSSGVLALVHSQHLTPKVSMLVMGMNAEFHKKAVGKIRFECNDGAKINRVIEDVVKNQIGLVCETHSKGFDEQGDCVADFFIKWTFRQKSK
jgi:hypothetical protein